MPDTYISMPDGSYVQVPSSASQDQLAALKAKLGSVQAAVKTPARSQPAAASQPARRQVPSDAQPDIAARILANSTPEKRAARASNLVSLSREALQVDEDGNPSYAGVEPLKVGVTPRGKQGVVVKSRKEMTADTYEGKEFVPQSSDPGGIQFGSQKGGIRDKKTGEMVGSRQSLIEALLNQASPNLGTASLDPATTEGADPLTRVAGAGHRMLSGMSSPDAMDQQAALGLLTALTGGVTSGAAPLLGKAAPYVKRGVAGAFAGDMGKNAVIQAKEGHGDDAALSAVMAVLAGKHALLGDGVAPLGASVEERINGSGKAPPGPELGPVGKGAKATPGLKGKGVKAVEKVVEPPPVAPEPPVEPVAVEPVKASPGKRPAPSPAPVIEAPHAPGDTLSTPRGRKYTYVGPEGDNHVIESQITGQKATVTPDELAGMTREKPVAPAETPPVVEAPVEPVSAKAPVEPVSAKAPATEAPAPVIEEPGKTTSPRNEVSNAERASMLLDALPEPEKIAHKEHLDAGIAKGYAGPDRAVALADQVARGKARLDPENTMALAYRKLGLIEEHKALIEEAKKTDDPAELARIDAEAKSKQSQFDTITLGLKKGGTDIARTLAARATDISPEMDVMSMKARAKIAKGEPLTAKENAKIEELSKRIEQHEARIAERDAQFKEDQATIERLRAEGADSKTISQVKRGADADFRRRSRALTKDELLKERDSLAERWRKSRGLDTKPEKSKPAARMGLGPTGNPTDPALFTKENVQIIRALAKNAYQRGNVTLDGIIDDVKTSLGNAADELTPRMIRDAISGYGQSKEPVDPETAKMNADLSKLNSIARRISKLEDAQAGKKPVKGEPVVIDPEVRRLQADLDHVLKQSGLADQPAKTKNSPLARSMEQRQAAATTRRLNEIERMKRDIKAGGPAKRTPLEATAQLDALEAEAKPLREKLKEMAPTKARSEYIRTEQQRIDAALKAEAKKQADLQAQIDAGKQSVKSKTAGVTNAALEASRKVTADLKAQRDALPSDAPPQVRSVRTMSAEAKLNFQIRSAEATAKRLEAEIATGKRTPKAEAGHVDPRLEAARKKVSDLKAQRDAAIPLEKKHGRGPMSLAELKASTQKSIDEYTEKTRSRTLPEQKAERPYDPEYAALKRQQHESAATYRMMVENLQRTRSQRVLKAVADVVNLPRTVMAGALDTSMPGRQGWLLAVKHPISGARAITSGWRAFTSQAAADKMMHQMEQRPNAKNGRYERSGLYLQPSELRSPMGARAEEYQSDLAEKIPVLRSGVQASSRAASVSMNRLRIDAFDTLARQGERMGEKDLEKFDRGIANGINKLSGRGSLGEKANGASHLLNTLLFSARFNASRLQVLAGEPLYGGTARSRALLAKEYAGAAAGIGTLLYLGHKAGGEVEGDLLHPEGLKLRFGSIVIDLGAGLNQWMTFLDREYQGKTKNSAGKVDKKDGVRGNVAARFIRSKASPVAGAITDVLTTKDFVGNKVHKPAEAMRNMASGKLKRQDIMDSEPFKLLTPMGWGDINEAADREGVPAAVVAALMQFNGVGVNVYPKGGGPRKR